MLGLQKCFNGLQVAFEDNRIIMDQLFSELQRVELENANLRSENSMLKGSSQSDSDVTPFSLEALDLTDDELCGMVDALLIHDDRCGRQAQRGQ